MEELLQFNISYTTDLVNIVTGEKEDYPLHGRCVQEGLNITDALNLFDTRLIRLEIMSKHPSFKLTGIHIRCGYDEPCNEAVTLSE